MLLGLSVAHADPAILTTAPGGFGAYGGLRGFSVGGQITDRVGAAVTIPWNAGTIGLSASGRWELAHGARGWGISAVVSGGPVISTRVPGLGVEIAPALVGGLVTKRFTGSIGVVAPIALGSFGGFQARIPILADLGIGVHAGPVWITAHLRIGVSVNPGVDTSLVLDPGVAIAFDRPVLRRRTAPPPEPAESQ